MKDPRTKLRFITIALLLVCGIIYWTYSNRHPRELTTEVYIWQRSDSPELRKAIERSRNITSRRHFLSVEIGRSQGQWQVSRSTVPDEMIAGNGLVIRIGASLSGETWEEGEALDRVLSEVDWMAAKPAKEFQIDYDSPSRSLGNYVRLLEKIKTRHPEKTWTITALPSWLGEADVKKLFTTADGVVMQLHSLKLPEKPELPVVLCDPTAAREAVRRMSKMGIPFHVALNTYSCEVLFDANNRVLDVISEDIQNTPPPNATRRSMGISDAVQLAGLVAEWKNEPPHGLQGIIWYRLPLETDRRNWKWATWQRVASGEIPTSDLRLEARATENGAWDVILTNHGERDERLPEFIDVGCETLVLEGLNGYTSNTSDQLHLETAPWPWLAPEASFTIGWLRTIQPSTLPKPSFGKSP